jgi:hypothetical protein
MSDPEKDLARQQLLAQALKDRIPLAAADPTSDSYADLDSTAHGFRGRLEPSTSEQAGVMFVGKDGKYSYSIPTTQKHRDSFALRMQNSEGSKLAGLFHTHPGPEDDAQVFSPDDLAVANKLKVPSYVMFQKTGEIRKYVPGVTKTKRVYIPRSTSQDYGADGDPVPKPADPSALVAALRPPPDGQ